METVVGLEIHVELMTKSKMFCSCGAAFALPPGSQCCPVCMGLPGALPAVNRQAVRLGALAALALHGEVQEVSRFDRKQYFYPDLPKGYQITQRAHPLCRGGWLTLPGQGKKIQIIEMHLEEDAGKLIHTPEATYVDLNRCGVPLLEIVTAPMMENGAEAYAFLNLLRDTLVRAGVTTGKMQQGALRVDVNVSIREPGAPLGPRTEMKNLSSFKAVRAAIDHESERQRGLWATGTPVRGETRRWDEKGGFSVALRGKEAEADYRYFPEPDLPPLKISRETLDITRRELPELPESIQTRLLALPGMQERFAALLATQPALLACFDAAYSAVYGAAGPGDAPDLSFSLSDPANMLPATTPPEEGNHVGPGGAPDAWSNVEKTAGPENASVWACGTGKIAQPCHTQHFQLSHNAGRIAGQGSLSSQANSAGKNAVPGNTSARPQSTGEGIVLDNAPDSLHSIACCAVRCDAPTPRPNESKIILPGNPPTPRPNEGQTAAPIDASAPPLHVGKILNWLLGDYRAIAKKMGADQNAPPFAPQCFAGLMQAVICDKIPYQAARAQLERLVSNNIPDT